MASLLTNGELKRLSDLREDLKAWLDKLDDCPYGVDELDGVIVNLSNSVDAITCIMQSTAYNKVKRD